MNQRNKKIILQLFFLGIVLFQSYGCQKKSPIPNVTTSSIVLIKSDSAFCEGTINSDGGSSISARGICWSVNPNPTIYDSKTQEGYGIGSFTSTITPLIPNTIYYMRAYATKSDGKTTGYGNIVSFTTLPIIGSKYQGGILAYILQPSDTGYDANVLHGIIAAPVDLSNGIPWGNGSFISIGANLYGIHSGNLNTKKIIDIQGPGNYAAKICSDLELGGYNDWYLPSLAELNMLYLNKDKIGGFAQKYYWSSTEEDAMYGRFENFANGFVTGKDIYTKEYGLHVRAVRYF